MSEKLCSKCKTRPKAKGQSYCRQCYNAYVRQYRQRKGITQQSRQPIQRTAVEDIPETVKARIAGDGEGWTVAVRQDQRWACVFRSDDREESLLVLGAMLGRDLRDSN